MDKIKNFGSTILGLAVFVVPILIGFILIRGMAWVGDRIVGWTMAVAGWVLVVDLILLLPLAIFRGARGVSAFGFAISSQVYGFAGLLLGFLACWHFGGWIGVLVGVLLGGFGLIPLGAILAAFHGEWSVVGNLALLFVCGIVSLVLTQFIGDRAGRKLAAAS